MRFIETSIFTKRSTEIITDDEYRLLQETLARYPDKGAVIQGSGGLRKIRWRITGKGKSGGIRIIYYWVISKDTILMLFVFMKNERSDLTPAQIAELRRIIEEEYP